ncbi:MAG TPA: hypothetical protein VF101_08345 [Gaiellaceae bacterium]
MTALVSEAPIDLGHTRASSWAALAGRWSFEGANATYSGPEDPNVPVGVAISDLTLRTGWIEAEIVLRSTKDAGRIVFGRDPSTGGYYSAGVGDKRFAYYLDQLVPGQGWVAQGSSGLSANLKANRPYHVELYIQGQHVWMRVDDVVVLSRELPTPLPGDQVGATAWGGSTIRFQDVRVLAEMPQAFVVMQFGEPYDSIYSDVIAPVAAALGFEARRADEFHAPGIILQDIITSLVTSSVIVAEITPPNPNVFYELGYAHALGKPTILLAERDRELPFDVSGYRVIFYDNTIAGKQAVEDDLRRHLLSILSNIP